MSFSVAWLLFNDDDDFRFNDTSTHEGHLHQNGILMWSGTETATTIMRLLFK